MFARFKLPSGAGWALAAVLSVIALAGSATAATGLFNGGKIKNATVTGKKIKNRSLGVIDLKKSAVRSLRGQRGEPGPVGPEGQRGIQGLTGVTGAKGATGATGPAGDPGVAGPAGKDGIINPKVTETKAALVIDQAKMTNIAVMNLSSGRYLVEGFVNLTTPGKASRVTCQLDTGDENQEVSFEIDSTTAAFNQLTLAPSGVTPDNSTKVHLRCFPWDSDATIIGRRLIAIPVG